MVQKLNGSKRGSNKCPFVHVSIHSTLGPRNVFGRGSAVRPPYDPGFLPAVLLVPYNQNPEAGLCTYCRKKVPHFGPPEGRKGVRGHASNPLLNRKLIIWDKLFFYNFWGHDSDICRWAPHVEHPWGESMSVGVLEGLQMSCQFGMSMNGIWEMNCLFWKWKCQHGDVCCGTTEFCSKQHLKKLFPSVIAPTETKFQRAAEHSPENNVPENLCRSTFRRWTLAIFYIYVAPGAA